MQRLWVLEIYLGNPEQTEMAEVEEVNHLANTEERPNKIGQDVEVAVEGSARKNTKLEPLHFNLIRGEAMVVLTKLNAHVLRVQMILIAIIKLVKHLGIEIVGEMKIEEL